MEATTALEAFNKLDKLTGEEAASPNTGIRYWVSEAEYILLLDAVNGAAGISSFSTAFSGDFS